MLTAHFNLLSSTHVRCYTCKAAHCRQCLNYCLHRCTSAANVWRRIMQEQCSTSCVELNQDRISMLIHKHRSTCRHLSHSLCTSVQLKNVIVMMAALVTCQAADQVFCCPVIRTLAGFLQNLCRTSAQTSQPGFHCYTNAVSFVHICCAADGPLAGSHAGS